MINVSKTWLPDIDLYISKIRKVWETGWITNEGQLVVELEEALKEYLGVKHLFIVGNGTIALQIGMKALGFKNEIITTPFSYIATTSSLIWQNCTPVFADIDPQTLCIDPNKIKSLITENTTGILATHVYGNPCDTEAIAEVAREHDLLVLYDAAHGFGVNYMGTSILNQGHISILSFHATKLFHTAEGGAVVCNSEDLATKIAYFRNFGHKGTEAFHGLGTNGKTSELHAAMGLCVLPKVNELIQTHKHISSIYDEDLLKLNLGKPALQDSTDYNFSYYPLIFENEEELKKASKALNEQQIFPRRYFYPSLNQLSFLTNTNECPISEDISSRVLCLPINYALKDEEVRKIASIIAGAIS